MQSEKALKMREIFWALLKSVLGISFLLLIPLAIGRPFIYTILILSGINALVALGLLLLVGYAGQISFGHAGFMAIGAYTSAIIATRYDLTVMMGMICGLIFTSLIAILIAIPILKLKGYYLAMATLAFGVVLSKLLIELEWLTGGPVGIGAIPPLEFFSFTVEGDEAYLIIVWCIVFVVYFFCKNILNSHIGRILKGIDLDEQVVGCHGVDVRKVKSNIFVFSAILASLAGSLYAHYMKYISPEVFSADLSVFLIMMVFLGGTSHVWGAILGALLLNILPEILRSYKDISMGLYGLALVLIVILMPKGLSVILVGMYKKLLYLAKQVWTKKICRGQ
ncbi:MAG: branched-chain amino acid ABC transporter permease [Deltaproteobacteria bacterium]|nr:branched-chain amino acid ABC transporter permease [Deltaproteobacteria bacterium]